MDFSLQEVINDSDCLLIGIGNEWDWVKKGLKNDSRYKELLKYCENKEHSWLLPIIEYEFAYYNNDDIIEKAYRALKDMIGTKKYFLVSDLFLQDALIYGFDPARCVYPCGTYMYLQTPDIEDDLILAQESPDFRKIVDQLHSIVIDHNGSIPENATFVRPITDGKELSLNQKRNEYFNINYNEKAYLANWEVYKKYLSHTLNSKLLILELGVGLDYPTVVRWPFERVAFINNKARFVRVNEKIFQSTAEIKEKTNSVPMNSVKYILQENEGL